MRKAFLALVMIFAAWPVMGQESVERDVFWSKIEGKLERALENGREHKSDYSDILANLKIVYPEMFAERFSNKDWDILLNKYVDYLQDGRWVSAVYTGYNLKIISPEKFNQAILKESEFKAMKWVFLINFRQYPKWAVDYIVRLRALEPTLGRGSEFDELQVLVADSNNGYVCRYHYNTRILQQEGGVSYYDQVGPWFAKTYASLKELSLSSGGSCELDEYDWQRMYRKLYGLTAFDQWRDSLEYLAVVEIAQKGLDVVLADAQEKAVVPESVRERYIAKHWEGDDGYGGGKVRITPGFRPAWFWSVGLGSSNSVRSKDVAFDGWHLGGKVMFFRLSKNWRAGGFGVGISKFDDGQYPGEAMGWQWTYTVTPLQWKKLAWEFTPYKKQIYCDVGLGLKTHGATTFLTLNF